MRCWIQDRFPVLSMSHALTLSVWAESWKVTVRCGAGSPLFIRPRRLRNLACKIVMQIKLGCRENVGTAEFSLKYFLLLYLT